MIWHPWSKIFQHLSNSTSIALQSVSGLSMYLWECRHPKQSINTLLDFEGHSNFEYFFYQNIIFWKINLLNCIFRDYEFSFNMFTHDSFELRPFISTKLFTTFTDKQLCTNKEPLSCFIVYPVYKGLLI